MLAGAVGGSWTILDTSAVCQSGLFFIFALLRGCVYNKQFEPGKAEFYDARHSYK